MKKILFLFLSALIGVTSLNATAISGLSFSYIEPLSQIHYELDYPPVAKTYEKYISLATQHNDIVDKLNAMNMAVSHVYGKIVSTSPFLIEYDSPKSEYVKVGNDYLFVTTYYYALIENPENGTQNNNYYSGYHTYEGTSTSSNIEYRKYSSCGNVFYDLYAQKQSLYTEYKKVEEELEKEDDIVNEITSEICTEFHGTYSPLFEWWISPKTRPQIECRETLYNTYSCGPTVFKVGCPAYVNCEGTLNAIQDDSLGRPELTTFPVIKNDKTMVPIRPLIDGLTNTYTLRKVQTGADDVSLEYDDLTKRITIDIGTVNGEIPVCMKNTEIELAIGSTEAMLNGVKYELSAPAQIINGKTMIPLRDIGEMLNCDVEWIEEGQYIVVSPMPVKEFRSLKKQEARKDDPFWGVLELVDINGEEYYHMHADEQFFGCEYIFPVVWNYSSEKLEESEFFDIYEAKRVIGTSEIANIIEFTDATEFPRGDYEGNINMTIEEFCEKYECYISDFRKEIVIKPDPRVWAEFFHLSIDEKGKIAAVTKISASAGKLLTATEGRVDANDLEPWFLILLKSFNRHTAG